MPGVLKRKGPEEPRKKPEELRKRPGEPSQRPEEPRHGPEEPVTRGKKRSSTTDLEESEAGKRIVTSESIARSSKDSVSDMLVDTDEILHDQS